MSAVRGSPVLFLALTGCMLGPDFVVPEVEVPEAYRDGTLDGESVANMPWWDLFQDDVLRSMIETAILHNRDTATAFARIAEARAALGFVRADQFPSFGAFGSASRADPGDETGVGPTGPSNTFRGGLDVFFEVDLWGKLRRSTEAARGELLATEASFVNVTITLVADVANAYLLLLDLDQRLAITKRTLQTRSDATRIIRDRFREGVVAALDVHWAEVEEATAEVAVAAIERAIAQTENALSVLLGRNPGRIDRGQDLATQLPPDVPAGLPSELLRRRPDIAVAQHTAAAQTARIGVAEALRFPQLSLTGALGLGSDDIDRLFRSSATFWSLGADAAGPLFEFGKNTRRVEVEEARAKQAVLTYEQTVLRAFAEVEDALVAVRTFRAEYEARTRQVTAAANAARLARALYDEQFTSYLDVLDAERSLFNAELERSTALRSQLQSIVGLYKALGGGWSPREDAEQPEDRRL